MNDDKTQSAQTDARLIEVESRIAEQERTLEHLNEVIIEQGKALEAMRGKLAELTERMREASADSGEQDAPPPHY